MRMLTAHEVQTEYKAFYSVLCEISNNIELVKTLIDPIRSAELTYGSTGFL